MSLNSEALNEFRDRDLESLLAQKKLHLVLDLDHTLLHSRAKTTLKLKDKELIDPNNNNKSVLSNLHEITTADNKVHVVKLRPGVITFLKKASEMFDLSIFSMSSEDCAKAKVKLLRDCSDNEVRFREVLSREDCIVRGKKTLDSLFSHERVVLIVDDSKRVWMNASHNETNLVKIAPFNFFFSSGSNNQWVKSEEPAKDEELARVLSTLTSVHGAFYGNDKHDCTTMEGVKGEEAIMDRDVRHVLKLVQRCEERERRDQKVKAAEQNMSLTDEVLNEFRDRDLESLLAQKKLHLVLDLDHTLIHSREKPLLTSKDKERINPCNNDEHILSHLHETTTADNVVKLIKLRPGVIGFLKQASTMFDFSIFTMAGENHAKAVVKLLRDCSDNEVRFREVLSREDCVVGKIKTLESLFSHERVVLIVDDKEEVWMNSSHNETNLIKIAPYNFFCTTVEGISNPRLTMVGAKGEEVVMDEELARVLRTLRSVHGAFYGNDKRDCTTTMEGVKGEEAITDRDVRHVLKLVRIREDQKVKAAKIKRFQEVLFDEPLNHSQPAKKCKTDNLVDPPCLAWRRFCRTETPILF